MIIYNEEEVRKVCEECASMNEASARLGIHPNTFRRIAKKLGCYNPNQAGKGLNKNRPYKIKTKDILEGKHPNYSTFKLKKRLLKEGIKQNACEVCGLSEWNGNPLNMELHHIDGKRTNHSLDNLQMICPNCHAQTETYRSKNIK